MLGKGRKKNANNVVMSLIGLGIGAAAFTMVRKRKGMTGNKVKSAMDQMKDPMI